MSKDMCLPAGKVFKNGISWDTNKKPALNKLYPSLSATIICQGKFLIL